MLKNSFFTKKFLKTVDTKGIVKMSNKRSPQYDGRYIVRGPALWQNFGKRPCSPTQAGPVPT